MFERLVAFLIRVGWNTTSGADLQGVYPPGPPRADGSSNLFDGLENAQLISLEILLSFVGAMSDRLEDAGESWPDSAPTADSLNAQKDRKGVLLIGAALFNAKPKQGLAMLEKEGVIRPDDGPGTDEEKRIMGIAKFLRHSTRLDKKLLGDYISRPDQIELLKAFIGLFDFRGVS
jgi:brefeldin A-resistance guanine nucleotide exchange factor 1